MTLRQVENFAISNGLNMYVYGTGKHNNSFYIQAVHRRKYLAISKVTGKIVYVLCD